MISHIEVSGFRSLDRFSLGLRPGVNLLVGPNGAGKTNILAFFEFLRHLTSGNTSQAVSLMGGANAVFRKTSTYFDLDFNCKAKVYGSVPHLEGKHLSYCYEFELSADVLVDSMSLNKQIFTISIRPNANKGKPKIERWDFTISHIVNSETGESNTRAEFAAPEISKGFERELPPSIRGKFSERSIVADLAAYVEDAGSIVPRIGRIFSGIENKILADFRGGTIFNIVPSQAKLEEDITKAPRIERTGAGIYAMLQILEKLSQPSPRRQRFVLQLPSSLRRLSQVNHKEVVDLMRLASDAIEDYEVKNDPFDNKLQIRLTIRNKGKTTTVLPLSSMSDGTVKWLALVLITLTSVSNFSVEEPENYLHPRMQQEFLRLLRSRISGTTSALVSTHSETILNACSPDEVIVVSFTNGRTVASRPKNVNELNQQISETGFGLGYFYVAGALDAS